MFWHYVVRWLIIIIDKKNKQYNENNMYTVDKHIWNVLEVNYYFIRTMTQKKKTLNSKNIL